MGRDIYCFMKYIISESQFPNYYYHRRASMIWELVKTTYPFSYPCDYNREEFIDGIRNSLSDVIPDDHIFPGEFDGYSLKSFAVSYFRDRILEHWDESCENE